MARLLDAAAPPLHRLAPVLRRHRGGRGAVVRRRAPRRGRAGPLSRRRPVRSSPWCSAPYRPRCEPCVVARPPCAARSCIATHRRKPSTSARSERSRKPRCGPWPWRSHSPRPGWWRPASRPDVLGPAPRAPSEGRIRAMFDDIVSRYDLLNDMLSWGFDRWWRRRALGAVVAAEGSPVLDLGCGTGRLGEHLAARNAVVGVDLSGEMLAAARRRLGDRIALVQASAMHLPFADGTFAAAAP